MGAQVWCNAEEQKEQLEGINLRRGNFVKKGWWIGDEVEEGKKGRKMAVLQWENNGRLLATFAFSYAERISLKDIQGSASFVDFQSIYLGTS